MNVLHRTTAELRLSVNTPDYSAVDWILDPREPASLALIPQKYRVIEADDWREMDAGEKAAVDAAELTAAQTAAKAAAQNVIDGLTGYELRAMANLLIGELNDLRQWITAFKAQTALATNLANFQSRVAGLANTPDRTLAQAKTAYKNALNNGTLDE
jgi:hypothetical protein